MWKIQRVMGCLIHSLRIVIDMVKGAIFNVIFIRKL